MTELSANESAALADLVFALGGPHTQEQVAERLDCSVRTVRRIETRALEKMRAAMTPGWESSLGEPSPLHLGMGRICPGDGRAWWGEEN